ncbi:hypothetical protein KKF34_19415 [Myxococcota bacterium]|nr:hypothetical protein [Myxococcota bacterium]MBU1383119.1 hypothetical protein [Myxococcota bacterium]MBU1499058.1 hypothetical protein [Myxococcota bacterium]
MFRRYFTLLILVLALAGCKDKKGDDTTPDKNGKTGDNGNTGTGDPIKNITDAGKPGDPGVKKPVAAAVSKSLNRKFSQMMKEFFKLGENGWDKSGCAKVAGGFMDLMKEKGGEKVATFAYNAGVTWYRCGENGKAKDALKKAISMAGSYPAAQMTLAVIEAKGDVNSLLSIESKIMEDSEALSDPDINYNYALAYYNQYKKSGKKQDMKKLVEYLRRALASIGKIDRETLEAVRIRSSVYAVTLLFYLEADRRKHANIDLANIFTAQAREFVAKTCDGKGAIKDNWAKIALANYHNASGLLAIYEKNIGRAFESFRKAIECDPSDYSSNLNIGMMGIRFRQPELAIKSLELVISKYPGKPGVAEAELAVGVAYKVYGNMLQDMADNQFENKERLETALKNVKEIHKEYKKGLAVCEQATKGGDIRALLPKLQPYVEEVKRRAWNAAIIRKKLDKGEITVKMIMDDVVSTKNTLDDAVNTRIPARIKKMETELAKLADVSKLKNDAKAYLLKAKDAYEKHMSKHSNDYRPVYNLAVLLYKNGDLLGDAEGNMGKAKDMFEKVIGMKGADKTYKANARKFAADIKTDLVRLRESKEAPKVTPKTTPKTAPKAAPKKRK